MNDERSDNKVDLAANLTMAWLANPNVRANNDDATSFLQSIHATLLSLAGGGETGASTEEEGSAKAEPAVTVRKSLASRDRIISLIDGKPYTALKRHLSKHGLTPAQYRERYGLKADYPMVAPAYAEKRRALAKKIGLGRKPAAGSSPAKAASPKPAPANGSSTAKPATGAKRRGPAKRAAPAG